MGHTCDATCLDCAHRWTHSGGGGFVFTQHVCDRCGNCMDLPRWAPHATSAPMSREALRRYLGSANRWPKEGRAFFPEEKQLLSELAGRCPCGGAFLSESDPNLVYRCPVCRGSRYSLGLPAIMFD